MNIIEANNVGKKYTVGDRQAYLALRDIFGNALRSPFSTLRKKNISSDNNEFWALKDVNFSVEKGDVVGIIGKNGAGKSTLLKILSQITPPTTGKITLRGRVGSLLEVGTGFHPELTGRENIFLNGAILGMRKREIEKKFDEIVEFSGVERFLDMPVKRYSSGMYVRLAFSVAAHLEPDILIIDEVLAVGDAEFQKKCLGKMQEVTRSGLRTILFVSHNIGAIQNLCSRVVLLDKGQVQKIGKTDEVVDHYLHMNTNDGSADLATRKDKKGNGRMRITGIHFLDASGTPMPVLRTGHDVYIRCTYTLNDPTLKEFKFAIGIDTFFDQARIAHIGNKITGEILYTRAGFFIIHIKKFPLNIGRYQFSIISTDNGTEIYDWVQRAGEFEVEYGDFYGNGHIPPQSAGMLLLDYKFEE